MNTGRIGRASWASVVGLALVGSSGLVTSAPAQDTGRDGAALVVEGVVREVFRSPRRGQVDVVLQLDVTRAELGRNPRERARVVAPAPGDPIYIHATDRPGAGTRATIPAERSQVRAYLVARPGGGWEAAADGFEFTAQAPAASRPGDPPPALAEGPGTPTTEPAPANPAGRSALTRLGLTAEPFDARGRFALRVKSVERGGAAQRAGLEPGDAIVAANDRELTGPETLDAVVARGGELSLVVLDVNSGRAVRVPIELGTPPTGASPPGADPTRPAPEPAPTPKPRRSLGFSAEPTAVGPRTGMKVTGVDPGGLAQKAGLEPGDVIVAVNGVAVTNVETLGDALRKSGPKVELTVRDTRTGRDTPVAIDLGGEAPSTSGSTPAPRDPRPAPAGAGRRLGVVGEVVFFDAEAAVKITEVEPGSPAERAGLRVGDVIFEADGTPILHPNTLNEVVAKSTGRLQVRTVDPRTGRKASVDVDLGSR